MAEVAEDTREVCAEGTSELADGLEPAEEKRSGPLHGKLPRRLLVGHGPELLELNSQLVEAPETTVDKSHPTDCFLVFWLKVSRVAKERKARAFESLARSTSEASALVTTDGVNSFEEELHNVETIIDDLCLGSVGLGGAEERFAHVHGNDPDVAGAFCAKKVEELVEGLGGLAWSRPHDTTREEVYDYGDVAMAGHVGGLVDSYVRKPIQPLPSQFLGYDPGDDATNGPPGHMEHPARRGLVSNLGEAGNRKVERLRVTGTWFSPRYTFHSTAVVRAVSLTNRCSDVGPLSHDVQVSPRPFMFGDGATQLLAALGAPRVCVKYSSDVDHNRVEVKVL